MDKDTVRNFLKYFHEYFKINLDKGDNPDILSSNVNLKINLSDVNFSGISNLNDDYSNVAFTSFDDFGNVFDHEFYKGTFFIKMDQYYDDIVLHILPEEYAFSNKVLLFKDDDLTSLSGVFSRDSGDGIISSFYNRDDSEYIINAKFQQNSPVYDGGSPTGAFETKNRDKVLNSNFPLFSKFQTSNGLYYKLRDIDGNLEWVKDNYLSNFAKYTIDFNNFGANGLKIKNASTIEINATYRYSEGTSRNITHYIGIEDQNNDPLFEMNSDNINLILPSETNMTNIITQTKSSYQKLNEFSIGEHEVNKDYNITLKYLNDTLIVTEEGQTIKQEWESYQ